MKSQTHGNKHFTNIQQGAARIGIRPYEYAMRIGKGLIWCTTCKGWKNKTDFSPSYHYRNSGQCRACNSLKHRKLKAVFILRRKEKKWQDLTQQKTKLQKTK